VSSFDFSSKGIPTSAERMPWLVVRADGTVLAGNISEQGARITAMRLEAFVIRRAVKPRHKRRRKSRRRD